MRTIRRSLAWFSKQKLVAKLSIGCVGILAFCCLCGGTTALLSPPSDTTTTGKSAPVAALQASPTAAPPTAPATNTPPFATSTASLSPTATIIPSATTGVVSLASPEPLSASPLQFHFINVGQGDSALIQTPGGKVVLIDGGDPNSGVVSYLQSLGVKRIDLMIATHPNADHIGGLVDVLKAMPVSKVITNGQPENTSVYENFLDGIVASGAEYGEVKRGSHISLDGIDFLVLGPASLTSSDLNENSIVLQFSYDQTTFLLMGDAGADTEASLLSAGVPLKADILKVGHHGSASASTMAFLQAVQPKVAIYSARINNEYGLPAPQTIADLKAVGATIYGTDQNGTIGVVASQSGYKVDFAGAEVVSAPASTATVATNIPTPASSGLTIVSVTSPISRGGNAKLVAKTNPNASCSITVYVKSGPSTAAGLVPKKADGSGQVSWAWKVGSRTTPGNWSIVVTCDGVTQETTFTVK